MTFRRRGDKNPLLWNIANDYVVNMDPVEGNVGEKIRLVDICFDYKYPTLTEEVYDDLFKQAEEEGRIIEMSALDVHLDMDESEDDEGAQGTIGNAEDGNWSAQYTKEEKRRIKEQSQERNPGG